MNRTINYIEDKNKTVVNDLEKALDYASNKDKTEESFYITGINCSVDTAFEEMIQTKKFFNKTNGILGYHGYQSFKENEVTPEVAHEIGVKLASEMWGDKYQVIVSTHLNTKHYHNHFVVNSVSFIDGKKFNSCRATTSELRYLSDKLCQEYGLSVVEEKIKPNRIYFPYYLNKTNQKNNYYETTKLAIDKAIKISTNYDEFIKILNDMNYEIKDRYGKLSVRNLKYKRNIRIERYFGSEYSIESIKSRIKEENEDIIYENFKMSNNYFKKKKYKSKGIVGLYYYYCFLLKIYPNKKYPITSEIAEDISKLNDYSKMIVLFDRENINSTDDFKKYEEKINKMYDELILQRKKLREQYKKINNSLEQERIIKKIKEINNKISILREDINICYKADIESSNIKNKINNYENIREKSKGDVIK